MYKNIDDLLNVILKTNFDSLNSVLEKYNGTDWEKFIVLNTINYYRYKLFKNDEYEIFIITWNTLQNAPIHDHSLNGCWLKVLKGTLIENIYSNDLKHIKTNELKTNHISFMKDNIGYHSINNKDEIAVTLHVYNPPNHKTTFFY
jgi:cysteine dioxygenase